jgi:hypothetical protein
MYGYPLKVVINWADEDFNNRLWKHYYLLEAPTGNFIHLEFTAGEHQEPPEKGKFWVNSEAISTIAIASND